MLPFNTYVGIEHEDEHNACFFVFCFPAGSLFSAVRKRDRAFHFFFFEYEKKKSDQKDARRARITNQKREEKKERNAIRKR